MTSPERVRVAFVRRPVGLRGELLVEPLTDNVDRFRAGLELFAGARRWGLESTTQRADGLILKLRGVDDEGAAAALRGTYLEVDAGAVEPLPEGSHYHWQLVGLEVVDTRGAALGRVVDVETYPANDIYVVRGAGTDVLVPATRSVVREIDLARGRMVVDLPAEEEVR